MNKNKNLNLKNYFICNNEDLSVTYIKRCEKFLRQLNYKLKMITLARQVQLKLKKFDEVMIKLKTKYLNNPSLYSELHKLDERKEEIQKLVDNSN